MHQGMDHLLETVLAGELVDARREHGSQPQPASVGGGGQGLEHQPPGQAIGVAAALCTEKDCDTRSLPVTELQQRLKEMGAYLPNA